MDTDAPYYDRNKIGLTSGNPVKDFYLAGTIKGLPGYTFKAKVYDRVGIFGLKSGRISKLSITNEQGFVVCEYNRGWLLKPQTRKHKQAAKAVIDGFPDRNIFKMHEQSRKAREAYNRMAKDNLYERANIRGQNVLRKERQRQGRGR